MSASQQANLLDLDEEVSIEWSEEVFPQRLYVTRFDERSNEVRFDNFRVNNVEISCTRADDDVLYAADGRHVVGHLSTNAATNKPDALDQANKLMISGELHQAYIDLTAIGRVKQCTVRAADGPGFALSGVTWTQRASTGTATTQRDWFEIKNFLFNRNNKN